MNQQRINIQKVDPNHYRPLLDLDANLRKSTLKTKELLLIYTKASQINGCAYCIQLHTKEAIEKGEKQYRLHALSTWRETPFFTEEEKVILAMTDEMTTITSSGLSDETYALATSLFSPAKIADIIMAISCINAWNIIGKATQLTPNKSQE